jgi:tRNA A-37 threonylcarbamoyl transferase component Bud32
MLNAVPAVGDIFEGRYELLEQLGSGAIGTVFRARQLDADRLVALKFLHAQVVIDEEFKQRFLLEARALSRVSHPNIVQIYHMGMSKDGVPFLAMELIDGIPLRRAIDGEPIAASRVFRIVKQLCSALACMHEAGIIHRDLKPENIILQDVPEPDIVKIIDFGLVKMEQTDGQKLTGTGFLLGTVSYMSPEQCQGKSVDARSDVYSLCVCLYEMLSGKHLFEADNPMGLMYKHINLTVPSLKMRQIESVDKEINAFLQKGLAKDPDKRFQSANQMRDELLEIEELFNKGGAARPNFAPFLLLGVFAFALTVAFLGPKILALTSKGRVQVSSAVNQNPVQKLCTQKGADNTTRCQNLLAFCDNHTGSPLALEAAERAMHFANAGLRTGHESLPLRCRYALAREYYERQRSADTLATLAPLLKLDENNPPENFGSLTILDLKAMAADSMLDEGQKEKSLALAQEVANWPLALSANTAGRICGVLLRLKRFDLVHKLINDYVDFSTSLDMASKCLEAHEFASCNLCLQHADKALMLAVDSSSSAQRRQFALECARVRLRVAQGQISEAQKNCRELVDIAIQKRNICVDSDIAAIASAAKLAGVPDLALPLVDTAGGASGAGHSHD